MADGYVGRQLGRPAQILAARIGACEGAASIVSRNDTCTSILQRTRFALHARHARRDVWRLQGLCLAGSSWELAMRLTARWPRRRGDPKLLTTERR